jgi:hypothetical protein
MFLYNDKSSSFIECSDEFDCMGLGYRNIWISLGWNTQIVWYGEHPTLRIMEDESHWDVHLMQLKLCSKLVLIRRPKHSLFCKSMWAQRTGLERKISMESLCTTTWFGKGEKWIDQSNNYKTPREIEFRDPQNEICLRTLDRLVLQKQWFSSGSERISRVNIRKVEDRLWRKTDRAKVSMTMKNYSVVTNVRFLVIPIDWLHESWTSQA